jgi:hypothetical protein
MAITKGYMQSQWEEIKREIRKGLHGTSRQALASFAEEALKEIESQSSYETDTGNLDESLAAGIYRKGRLDQIIRLHKGGAEPYVARTDTTVNTRWGYQIPITKGQTYSGKEESHKALNFYTGMVNHKYPEDMTMVLVAEMFYRYFLEDKNGMNWIAGFANFEQSDAIMEAKFKKEWYQKMMLARWGKNVRVEG